MRLCLLPLLCLALAAQDRYQKTSADQPICPKVIDNSEGVRPGGVGRPRANSTFGIPSVVDNTLAGSSLGKPTFLAPDQRPDASAFVALDRGGKPTSVADLRGKVVVIGLWTIGCDPSLNQLGEMVDLQGKGDKFGFKVLPVNMDPERWTAITPWLQQNADRLSGGTIYTPGAAEHGPGLLSADITGLPAVFITDRQGRVACVLYGYERKNLVNALKQVLGQNPPAKP